MTALLRDGAAWVFGDHVDTDVLAPGAYMKGPVEQLAAHCLETLRPEFARDVRPGDLIVAGEQFGIGSSREQAAEVLVRLGVGAVVARSFGGIFFRNALNLGLVAVRCDDAMTVRDGDRLRLDAARGVIDNRTQRRRLRSSTLPPHLLAMVDAGGLIPYLERQL